MSDVEKIRLRAYANLAYWFQIPQKEAQIEIDQCLDRNESDEMTTFWFLRSIALNCNISGIPFENRSHTGAAAYIQQALDDYWQQHAFIDKSSISWIGFDKRSDVDIRTSEGFISVKSYNSVPNWIDSAFQYYDYMDNSIYPQNPDMIDREMFFQALISNYILNNVDSILSKYRDQILHGIKTDVYNDILLRSVSLSNVLNDDNSLNRHIALNYIMSQSGIRRLLSRNTGYHADLLKEAKKYFKVNGFVFPVNTPKFPYGFDIMLANLGYLDQTKPAQLWSSIPR